MKSASGDFYELAEQVRRRPPRGMIPLHIGNTALPVPDAALTALARLPRGRTCGYGPTAGLPELRRAIAAREGREPEEIAVGPGSKFLLFALLSLLKRARGGLVLPAPYWPAYPLMADRLGVRLRVVRTRLAEGWEPGAFEIGGATALLFCNPLNPTGTCYRDATVRRLAREAAAAGVPLIVDEAYRELAFRPLPVVPAIRVRSFSKEFNLEGYRLGYVVAPPELVREIARFMEISVTGVAEPIQRAGLACLRARAGILRRNRAAWRRRLDRLSRGLRDLGFEFATPEAAMYVFARHPRVADGREFAARLLDRGVAVAAGAAFGPYPRFMRISASADEATLSRALDRIAATLE